jgi:uncharacterized protein involved in response to NO
MNATFRPPGGTADTAAHRAGFSARCSSPLWARGFRPFFLLAGFWGCLAPVVWVAAIAGGVSAPAWLAPSSWHAHEMIFGWVAAAIAGFLLTAVPVWTATEPVTARALFGLAALWVAGRVVMLAPGALNPIAVAVIDVGFLPVLATCLVRPLATAGQRRNWGFVPILLALCAANAAMHAETLGIVGSHASVALRFAVALVVVLIVVVGGRITPAFTRNAFAARGIDATIRMPGWSARASIALVALLPALELALPRTPWSGAAELAAALAVAGRMAGWQTFRTRRDPLLWSLHAGYAWVAIGLGLLGVADLWHAIPSSAGLHALTAGAMGSMILAVMTRVALGHTGRPLVAPRGIALAFCMVHLGAFVRVGSALLPGMGTPALALAAIAWSGAFGLFLVLYASILLGPRVDGNAG